jgi:hypothetical protein
MLLQRIAERFTAAIRGIAAVLGTATLLIIGCPLAAAATITASFSGTVSFPDSDLPYGLGDPVSGSFMYQSDAVASPTNFPFTNPTPMGTANYLGQAFTLHIAGDTYTAPYSNIGIGDTGTPLIVVDFLSVSGPPVGPAHGAYVPFQISLLLMDATNTVFSSNALPPPPVLSQNSFTSLIGSVEFGMLGVPFDRASVSFSIDAFALPAAVAAIPEPSTYALMLAGLGLVVLVAQRRRKTALA